MTTEGSPGQALNRPAEAWQWERAWRLVVTGRFSATWLEGNRGGSKVRKVWGAEISEKPSLPTR